jgi:hypothetical protein
MFVPDDTTEAKVMRIVNPDDSTGRRLPQDGSARVNAKFAGLTASFHVISLR